MKEIWKDIQGYEGLYQISSIGRVRSLNRINHFEGKNQIKKYQCGQLLKGKVLKYKYVHGYTNVTLYTEKYKHKQYQVHRLVAQAFIPNPNNYPVINHINSIRDDNRVENLEWCTYSHNNREAFRVGFNYKKMDGNNPCARKITQYDLSGKFVKTWESIATACRSLNIARTSITECLSGKRKTAYKSIWKYADEDTE